MESVLPFSSVSFTGNSILLQGIELGTIRVPLHKVELSSDLVTGSIVVGLRPSLSVKRVAMTLGNNIAGGQVDINSCVSDSPICDSGVSPVLIESVPGLFPACAVTQAMAQRALSEKKMENLEQLSNDGTPTLLDRY